MGRDPHEVREWVTGVKGERVVQGERRVMQRPWGGSVPCASRSARWHTRQPNGGWAAPGRGDQKPAHTAHAGEPQQGLGCIPSVLEALKA